ncbi:hypothetical protein [Limnofasciculus baicalensis]|uniref:Uncharacterized protein n=1 Tax=Limnofasciculus baicalensis BBK-W-15 TaxID=2699891 RepID=A0AAE3GVM0_9CYAN|nr:hypothetical protein [Limnofasciculus baicalensis]MCP2731296.1 hypothetical protein [Limnofasciculus baicalensis BBK-W-15]MCP2731299.1 hypothetical protein [Limnofasciculus baicalensis BBK-W-15]
MAFTPNAGNAKQRLRLYQKIKCMWVICEAGRSIRIEILFISPIGYPPFPEGVPEGYASPLPEYLSS